MATALPIDGVKAKAPRDHISVLLARLIDDTATRHLRSEILSPGQGLPAIQSTPQSYVPMGEKSDQAS